MKLIGIPPQNIILFRTYLFRTFNGRIGTGGEEVIMNNVLEIFVAIWGQDHDDS